VEHKRAIKNGSIDKKGKKELLINKKPKKVIGGSYETRRQEEKEV